jgi:undecaprenyl-diphosphatase
MLWWQAVSMGALQGVAELFPISSLAQTILVPALLDWQFAQSDRDQYLSFVVALHLATAIALVLYFWKDWYRVMMGFLGCFTRGKLVYDKDSKFAWMLVAGCIVVGAAGLALDKRISKIFQDPSLAWIVGVLLVVNGFVMLFGDFMKRVSTRHAPPPPVDHPNDLAMHAALVGKPVSMATEPATGHHIRAAEDLSLPRAALVGAAQTFALLPGISRSGVTMVAGLFAGLTYEESSRFTFMLATPVIMLAALKKLPELIKAPKLTMDPETNRMIIEAHHNLLMMSLIGSAAAFVCGYLSIRFLMKYFHTHRLMPFAIFCVLFGLFSAVYLKPQAKNHLTQNVGVNPGTEVITENPPTSR